MSEYRMRGGITVTSVVTGTHVIEDIKVPVPFQIAVFIPADVAYRSKDLWRSLQQGRIFELKGGSGLAMRSPPIAAPMGQLLPDNTSKKLIAFEVENTRLQEELAKTRQRNRTLEEEVSGMRGQLGDILSSLGRIEKSGGVVGVAPAATAAASEAVGGEVPIYVPDIKSDNAKASIQVERSMTEGSSVEDAASTLKDLRQKS